MDFSDVLRDALKKSGLSQAGLGRVCGLKGPHVNMICQRKATPPIELLETMADALHLSGEKRYEFIKYGHLAHSSQFILGLINQLNEENLRLREELADAESRTMSRVAEAIEQYKPKPPPIPEAWPMPKERVKTV